MPISYCQWLYDEYGMITYFDKKLGMFCIRKEED